MQNAATLVVPEAAALQCSDAHASRLLQVSNHTDMMHALSLLQISSCMHQFNAAKERKERT